MQTATGMVPVALAAVLSAHAASGQGTTFDGSFGYAARDEVTDQNDPDQSLDNDLVRFSAAVSWSAGDGRMRAGLELGVMNEDFSGDYPGIWGGELAFARRVGNQRYGIYGRIRSAEPLSTTTEIGYGLQHLGTAWDLRGLVGGQFVSEADDVRGRSPASLFGLGEATFYATPNWAISAGLQGDNDGAVWGVGTEYRGRGWGGVSLFVDYAEAFDDYRDVPSYDTLSAGIRWIPGAGSTLRAQRQSNLGVLTRRYVEVQ